MGKWLAIAAAALLVVLLLMWRSMGESSAEPPPEPKAEPVARAEVPKLEIKKPVAEEAPAPVDDKPKKLDPMGDEFFYKFIEEIPAKLSKNAVECYNNRTGSLHRNQKLVLAFNVVVKNGEVTIQNVHQKPPDDDEPNQRKNTLNDPALESCFISQVARTTWHDDSLPDYEWPDELTLRPERGLKKYWKSNVDYVGEEAPKIKKYEHPAPK